MNVDIIQLSPTKQEVSVVCDTAAPQCFATLGAEVGRDNGNYLDIAFNFDSDAAYFQFLQDQEYLSTTPSGNRTLKLPSAAGAYKVQLYEFHPLARRKSIVVEPVVRTWAQPVVEMEIRISPAGSDN